MSHLSTIADVLAVVGPLFVWLWRFSRRLETAINLALQTSNEHLPFIYRRLKEHDGILLLDSPDHPNIGFVNGTVRARN